MVDEMFIFFYIRVLVVSRIKMIVLVGLWVVFLGLGYFENVFMLFYGYLLKVIFFLVLIIFKYNYIYKDKF